MRPGSNLSQVILPANVEAGISEYNEPAIVNTGAQQRRSEIEIFDLKTLNIIAPVQMIRNYQNGKYVSFSFDKSVRIRINNVRGKNAAVSGIFLISLISSLKQY